MQIQCLCTLAQYQQQTQVENRYHAASQNLQNAEKEIDVLMAELETVIKQHLEKEEVLKKQDQVLQGDLAEPEKPNETSSSREKGKERERSPAHIYDDWEGTSLNEEPLNRRRGFQQRLREVRIVQHRIKFLQGDVYHMLGGQQVALENEAYSTADEIRRDLLKGTSFTLMRPQRLSVIIIGAESEATRTMVALNTTQIKDSRGYISVQDILVEIPFLQDGCNDENSLRLVSCFFTNKTNF